MTSPSSDPFSEPVAIAQRSRSAIATGSWWRARRVAPAAAARVVALVVAVLVVAVLVVAACGGGGDDDGAATGGDDEPATTAGAPIEPIEPTSLHTLPVAWPDGGQATDRYHRSFVATSGTDEVLVGMWGLDEPAIFAAGNVDDGTWRPVAGIPDADERPFLSRVGDADEWLDSVTVGGDVHLVGARCPHVVVEDHPACEGTGEVEVWRLPAGDDEWELAVSTELEALSGSPGSASTRVLGVTGDRIVAVVFPDVAEPSGASVGTAGAPVDVIVGIDPAEGTVEPIAELPADDERNTHPLCTTGDGTVVGAALAPPSERGAPVVVGDPFARRRLATLRDGRWTVHDDVAFDPVTGLDHLACGAGTAVVLTDDLDAGELRYAEVDVGPGGEGAVVRSGVLPAPLAFAAHLPPCDFEASFPVPQFTVEAQGSIGLVRDFGDVTRLDGSRSSDETEPCDGVDADRQVVVLAELDAEPLVHDGAGGPPFAVRGAARLADGRVVVLVDPRRHVPDDQTRFGRDEGDLELLVAA